MEYPVTLNLFLHNPIYCVEDPELSPFDVFAQINTEQEFVFCFELNREQAERIDPDADNLLGELVFAGRSGKTTADVKQKITGIPAGQYLFSQEKKVLGKNECIYLAAEQQKDGLWERNKLGNRLYIRRLFEDASHVTQIIRQIL